MDDMIVRCSAPDCIAEACYCAPQDYCLRHWTEWWIDGMEPKDAEERARMIDEALDRHETTVVVSDLVALLVELGYEKSEPVRRARAHIFGDPDWTPEREMSGETTDSKRPKLRLVRGENET